MEVLEVIRLADWFETYARQMNEKWGALVSVLQHNAQQQNKQPVEAPLIELSDMLGGMQVQQLSNTQLRLLEENGVVNLIGQRGMSWVNDTVRNLTYDPATSFKAIQAAANEVSSMYQRLRKFKEAAQTLNFHVDDEIDAPNPYIVTVTFKGAASISNVRDWKSTAQDWELIIAGAAGMVGEKPEEVSVVGTSNGSIIFWLSASAAVVAILARISRDISAIANNYLDFQLKREELERSKMMTQGIRQELDRLEKERKATAVDEIVASVKEISVDPTPEKEAKLKKAITKQISFTEKGGEVDFITPREIEEEADGFDAALAAQVDDLRQTIEAFRLERQQLKLLTQTSDGSGLGGAE